MAEFWRSGPCTVWVELAPESGDLVFTGWDREYLDGYEYIITVPAAQLEAVLGALGGAPDDDLVTLVCARVDAIMARGERSWLDEHGISYGFQTW